MTELKEQSKKKRLGLSQPGKLELKKTVESGQVRQNFSHGRSKMVAVEVRKKRTYAPDAVGDMTEVRDKQGANESALLDADRVFSKVPEESDSQQGGPSLTFEEKAVRAHALEEARKSDVLESELNKLAKHEASKEAAADAITQQDIPTGQKPKDTAPAKDKEDEAKKRDAKATASAALAKLQSMEEPHGADDKKSRDEAKRHARTEVRRQVRKGDVKRRSGKLTIDEALGVREERTRSLASVKRARAKQKHKFDQKEAKKIIHEVILPETISVQELSNRMAERASDVIKSLMKMDVMASIDQIIDADTAELVVSEFGHNIKRISEADVEIGLKGKDDDSADLIPRAPVVTVMGHVDHGKTSILDAMRKTNVADREAGGITQHIGAYQITGSSGNKITFIDTPGHAAFTSMRARGAKITDIVVLVVAGDDGIMPQTIEAISHAKAAEVPIIIAINKMDKPGADANRVRTEFLQHDIVVEEMGGEVLTVEVSAKEGSNLDKLEEAITLQAELMDLKANPNRSADGVTIESKVSRGQGAVVTVLVQRGTLRPGDILVAGGEWGRVRALINADGQEVKEAGPSMPVEILGISGTPFAGDEVDVVDNEARAREVVEFRQRQRRDAKSAGTVRTTIEDLLSNVGDGKTRELPVVLKTDVNGSEEAIIAAMEKMATDEVKIQVLHSGVGGISESDITLAHASNAMVLGFNVRANPQARALAKRDNVEINYYAIIYNLLDDLKNLLSGMLKPMVKETFLGNAEIREIFNVSKVGKVAGCMVVEGSVRRGAKVRLVRDSIVIHEGELSQLKRFKDDVKEVKEGYDCGMAFANYQDIQIGDTIECFEVEEIARQLED